jgi:hypothetical protein
MSEYLERLRKKRDCPDARAKLEQQKIDKEQSDKEAMYADLFKDTGLEDEPLSDDDELWVDDSHHSSHVSAPPPRDMWGAIDEIEAHNAEERIRNSTVNSVRLHGDGLGISPRDFPQDSEDAIQLPLYERVWFRYGASSLGLLAACAEIYRAFKY